MITVNIIQNEITYVRNLRCILFQSWNHQNHPEKQKTENYYCRVVRHLSKRCQLRSTAGKKALLVGCAPFTFRGDDSFIKASHKKQEKGCSTTHPRRLLRDVFVLCVSLYQTSVLSPNSESSFFVCIICSRLKNMIRISKKRVYSHFCSSRSTFEFTLH